MSARLTRWLSRRAPARSFESLRRDRASTNPVEEPAGTSIDQDLVGEGGLEPPRPCGHRNLNPARLPIPPLARGVARLADAALGSPGESTLVLTWDFSSSSSASSVSLRARSQRRSKASYSRWNSADG